MKPTAKPSNIYVDHTRCLHGRRVVYSDAQSVDASNVSDILKDTMNIHLRNANEIDYLYRYYRGEQPILYRVKEVRPEICNRIVENRANEIVSFKVGYLCGEPIQYVSRNGENGSAEAICLLNELMFGEDKASKDQEIVEWQMICGTAYRMVLPDAAGKEDESPFEIYTLDPRNAFVVYSKDIGNKPLMGVKYYTDKEGVNHYSVYTENRCFGIDGDKVVSVEAHALDSIPIFEYPANNSRLGSFEIVLPLLDMLNNIDSNRMDGMEQTIQAFIKFINCDISEEDFAKFKALGAIKVKSSDGLNADVDIVTNDLNQDQSHTLREDVYNSVLTICGVPSVGNGNSSDSSNNGAVILKNGWQSAEARAKDSEHVFKRAEKKMLKLVLRICRDKVPDFSLRLSDIELQFTRRNYENIQSKAQVLTMLLAEPKVHPMLAFQHSGLFIDPEAAYQISKKYYDEQQEKWEPVEVEEDAEAEVEPVQKV